MPALVRPLAFPGSTGDLAYEMPGMRQVIELSKEQERTKQQDARTKEAEFQAAAKQYAIVSGYRVQFTAHMHC